MRINDFDVYSSLLKQKSGLNLTPDKSYLIESRLTPVAKQWGFANLDELTRALTGIPDPGLIKDVVEAMTTNETSFFRDTRPFDQFKSDLLPFMMNERARSKRLRIWCAACSSGQEPYSLSMIIKDLGPKLAGWQIEIIATDIDHKILDIARKGRYSQFEVQRGLPIQMLMNYFEQVDGAWQLKDAIRSMVKFQYFNLLESMAAMGTFDIIFCRNVLIYFDVETKKATLDKLKKQLAPDGFLYLGGAETVMGITDSFVPSQNLRGVYMAPSHPLMAKAADPAKTVAG